MFENSLGVDAVVFWRTFFVEVEDVADTEHSRSFQHVVGVARLFDEHGREVEALSENAAKRQPDCAQPAADSGFQRTAARRAALQNRRKVLQHKRRAPNVAVMHW